VALSSDTLKSSLIQALQKTFNEDPENIAWDPPNIPIVVANSLADAYDSYVSSGSPTAGTLSIVSPGIKSVLASALIAPLMTGWAPGLIAYWTPVVWTGPGFIPINPTIPVPLAGIAPEISSMLSEGPQSLEDATDKISKILHKYTTLLTVTATTIPPASIVSILPVT
jgi:hypothetical protein